MPSLQSRVVLLSGATSGLGRALALQLRGLGASLALCGRSEEKLARLAEELPEAAGSPPPLLRAFCVSSEDAIVRFVDEAETRLGPLDVLINCAGANTTRTPVGDTKTADLDWMLAVNLRAPFIFMREAFRRMKARRRGHVVNILSTTCLFANENLAAYTASKAGIDALTKVFRKEARAFDVRVTSVYPGGIDTPFRAEPRPQYMTAESMAEAVLALLQLPDDAVVHELVVRPLAETNFA